MRVGHRLLPGRVCVHGLALGVLVRGHPGVLGDGRRCGRGRGRGRRDLPHDLLDDDTGLGLGRLRVGRRPRRGATGRGVGLADVGTVHVDLQAGRDRLARVRYGEVVRPERAQVGVQARHDELAQRVVKCGHAVAALAIGGHGPVGRVAQDPPDEAGQDGARPDLHEGADAVVPHAADLLLEPHRPGDRAGEQGPDERRVGRIGLGGGVGVGVRAQGRHRHRGQRRLERGHRVRHHGGVERGCDLQPREPETRGLERRLGADDRRGLTAHHDLPGAIVVGQDDAGHAGEALAHGLGRRRHGRHAPPGGRRGVAHELAPSPRDGDQGVRAERPRRVQGGELAEAVPRGAVGLQTGLAQEPQQGQAAGADGGLRPLGAHQGLALRLERGLVQAGRWEDHVGEPRVGVQGHSGRPVPGVERPRPGHGDRAAHPEILAALAGEEERDPPGLGAVCVVDRRRREGLTVPRLDLVRGLCQAVAERRLVGGHDGHPRPRGAVEALLRVSGEPPQEPVATDLDRAQ